MTHILLSHHYPEEYNRCIKITFRKKEHYLCARCFGYFSSFFIFFFFSFLFNQHILSFDWIILYLLPSFAVIDWALSLFKMFNGTNTIRYLTGFLLGITGSRLIFLFLSNPFNPKIYFSIVPYFTIIGILLIIAKNFKNQASF